MRRSGGAETDYLATASHFGQDIARADLNQISVGAVQLAGEANETTDFLNKLKTNVAVDKKKPVLSKKARHEVYLNDDTAAKGMQTTLRTTQLNQDLEEAKQFMDSQASNLYLDDQLDYEYPQAKEPHKQGSSP